MNPNAILIDSDCQVLIPGNQIKCICMEFRFGKEASEGHEEGSADLLVDLTDGSRIRLEIGFDIQAWGQKSLDNILPVLAQRLQVGGIIHMESVIDEAAAKG